jgi:S-adenosyl-L-methionine hydrolase (adenosine-forming)
MRIVTLTTDFGAGDYFVGAMKGALLSVNADAKIVDITHEIEPQNIRSAAFNIFAAYRAFPEGAIHAIVVDPGVGSARRALVVVGERHLFVAPDNGVLSLVYENEPEAAVFEITNDRFFRQPVSRTFHGRDVFAPVAGALSLGVLPSELGEQIYDFVRFETARPRYDDAQTIVGEIIHIDRFGNCITNIKRDDFPIDLNANNLRLTINGREISKLHFFYAEAESNEIFMIAGSADFLEISKFQKSAAAELNVNVGQKLEFKIL